MTGATVLVAIVLIAAATVAAQERSLREMIEDQNGPVEKRSSSNMPPVAFEDLVRGADIIVLASVEDRSSYLSADGRDVYTDLTLSNVQYVYPPGTGISSKPGVIEKLVVTQLGGEVTINGHTARSIHDDLLPLRRGTYALFLLNRADEKLFIARKYLGVFAPQNGRVNPLTQVGWFAEQHRGKSWDDFVERVASIATSRRQ